jgi:hypothetical protein
VFIYCTGVNVLQEEEQVCYDPEVELRSEL